MTTLNAGEIVLELPPSTGNSRNSEGSFVTLGDGAILFAWSCFLAGRGGDDDAAVIAARRSADGGRTWGPPQVLVEREGAQNVMSVSLLRLADGRIALLYLLKNSFLDCRPRLRFSSDEAATWSAPSPVIPAPGYFVVNNDRLVQLRSGRLVVPACYHRCKDERNPNGWETFDGRGIAIFFLSDDGGATWRESDTWWALPVASRSGLQEPGAIELADGRLLAWCRTDAGCQYGMESRDGGANWTPPAPTEFRSPCSPLSMKRIPSSGELLAVWNDHAGRFALPPAAKESWGRTPLVAAVSADDAKTWRNHKIIESDPESGYCYTAIHFTEDAHVLLAYCTGGKRTGSVLNTLRIRRVPVEWFVR